MNGLQSIAKQSDHHYLFTAHFFRGAVMSLLALGLVACDSGSKNSSTVSSTTTQYTVTPSAGSNGNISQTVGQSFGNGDQVEFTITPDDLFTTRSVTGTCGGSLSGNTFTTDALTENCTVLVDFGPPDLVLTPSTVKNFGFSWKTVSAVSEYRILENLDGMSGYTEVALVDAGQNSHNLEVFLPGRINASYMLTACNSDGCAESEPVFVSGTLAESVGYIKASNPGEGDHFGLSIALSNDGSTLAVGAANEGSNATGINGNQDNNTATNSGAVYVFTRMETEWTQQAYLKASNTAEQNGFGQSLTIAGDCNTLAVGAPGEASSATGIDGDQFDTSAIGSGAVYLFTRNNAKWSQQAYLKASNAEAYDYFGASLSLSSDGNKLAIGAIGEASDAVGVDGDPLNNLAGNSGAVYVFTRDTNWTQQAYIKASNTGAGDSFGWILALASDGNTLAVGAIAEASKANGINGDQSDNSAPVSGAVYIFHHDGISWLQQAYVKASNSGIFERFGASVALADDGNTMAVGAYFESQTASLSGAVYVFVRSGTFWSQQAYLKASNIAANDRFGASLALTEDGNTLAVGALFESSNATGINGDQFDESASKSGAVYLFNRDGGSWLQHAYVKASNTGIDSHFGYDIAISGDGSVLAVGAYQEDGSSSGIDGDQADNSLQNSGAVYLY